MVEIGMTYQTKENFTFRRGGETYRLSLKEKKLLEKLIKESPRMVSFAELKDYCKCSHDLVRKMVSDLRPIVTHEGLVIDTVTRQGYRIGTFGVIQ